MPAGMAALSWLKMAHWLPVYQLQTAWELALAVTASYSTMMMALGFPFKPFALM
jgi:nitrate reductase beta subunit